MGVKIRHFFWISFFSSLFVGLAFDRVVQAHSSGIIINEIMVSSLKGAKKEFVELYNLSESDVDLSGYKLTKKTKNCNESNLVSSASFFGIIPSKGYFLISSSEYQDEIEADLVFSGVTYTIANDNTILLYNSKGILVDKVGYGEACDFEGNPASAPGNDESLERLEFRDFDNNLEDFRIISTPTPRNSRHNDTLVIEPDHDLLTPDYFGKIRINEILPNPSAQPEKSFEFVELYNMSDEQIDLHKWKIKDKNSEYILSGIIKSKEYAVFYKTVSLNNDGDEIKLYDLNDNLIDLVTYDNTAKEDYSYGFNGTGWQWSPFPTPGKENFFRVEKNNSQGLWLNEIMPFPSASSDEEYIEIFNSSKDDVELEGWKLKDSSRSKPFYFPKNARLEGGRYMVIKRQDYKFALNNSGNEKVYLLNAEGEIVSEVSYNGAKKGVSYNFDGSKWRWSRYLTPGEKNKFNEIPQVKAKFPRKAYSGALADFSVSAKDKDRDKLKYVWSFGDGRKSYKKKTRHIYKETGSYEVQLKVFDGSEEVVIKKLIRVVQFPRQKVEIIAICPNPSGIDSKEEWILVKNGSSQSVNLKNWSVATGSKRIINHPIIKDLIIKSGEFVKITRDDSNFVLNNKGALIELRYPDGKRASRVKYRKENNTSADDDEVYEKSDDGWRWRKNISSPDQNIVKEDQVIGALKENNLALDEEEKENAREDENEETEYYNQPQVMGVEVEKSDSAPITKTEKKVRIGLMFKFIEKVNYFLNKLLNLLVSIWH